MLSHYRALLVREPSLQWAEIWSLASYSKDLSPAAAAPVRLPPGRLRGTAEQVLADLDATHAAYQEYLLACAVPLLIQADPRFGNRESQLVTAVSERVDSIPAARAALAAIRRYGYRSKR
ncbi:hypothetical protein [Tsukamurella paurometabola]|uniref:hypothetical protein n=1 Tax=Tsukamurella paurometabola TaxID=2061 RepID=UPI0011C05D46|nr:hypothetical protein [Tsukamurella paurometabola]